jgi:hypothetical protein
MREPRRLIEQDGGLAAALLRAGSNVAPPPAELVERVFVSVEMATAAGMVATSAAATGFGAAKKVMAIAVAKWALGGVVAGAALSVATIGSDRWGSRHEAPVVARPTAARTPSSPSPPVVAKSPERELAPGAEPAPAVSVRPEWDRGERPKDSAVTLAAEVALLDAVRTALDGGSAARAMELLDRYEREFPRGQLLPEALLFRVRAYRAAGNAPAASNLAAQLLAKSPEGAYANRVREAAGMISRKE